MAAIEPNPRSFRYLSYVLRRLGRSNVRAICAAASDREGKASLNIPVRNGIEVPYETTVVPGGGPVACITLDSLQMRDVALIKVDAEGHELPVVKGGVQTISMCKPVLLLEWNPDAHEWALARGYSAFVAAGGELKPYQESLRTVNVWYLPPGRLPS